MKILIVDDSSFMRKIVRDILEDTWDNVEILEASDGNEAVDIYRSEHPDHVLLDIIMPEKDGIAVLKEIGKSASVVVISAAGQEKMIDEAKSLGAKDFIVKPFDSHEVREKLKGIFG